MSLEFPHCPFCESSNWTRTNSSRTSDQDILDSYRCGECKKFTYTNLTKSNVTTRHSVECEVTPYWIQISYVRSKTSIRNSSTFEEYLALSTPLQLNWNAKDIVDKIKMLMIFS